MSLISVTRGPSLRHVKPGLSCLPIAWRPPLSVLGYPDNELSISIVGDSSIRRINREYLGKDRPTNVISFSMHEGDFGEINPHVLGDVIISADTALREADECGITLDSRLVFLLLHG